MEIGYRVTWFAAIFVRLGCKLSVVFVLMTIQASCKFHFVNRVFTRRNMAFGAFNPGVHAFQRIFRRGMLPDPER